MFTWVLRALGRLVGLAPVPPSPPPPYDDEEGRRLMLEAFHEMWSSREWADWFPEDSYAMNDLECEVMRRTMAKLEGRDLSPKQLVRLRRQAVYYAHMLAQDRLI